MILHLNRYGSTPMGTFGELEVGGEVFQTVERPYLDNARRISCVPAGIYRLETHNSTQDWIGDTWALVNEGIGVCHYPNSKAKRDAILIHTANHMHQLEGCIGIGSELGCVSFEGKSVFGVWNSKKSMNKLRDIVDTERDHTLVIKWLEPEAK